MRLWLLALLMVLGSAGLLWRWRYWQAPLLAPFCVYYGSSRQTEPFAGYHTLILSRHSPLPGLLPPGHGKTLAAYVSLGEAEQYEPYFAKIAGQDWVLSPNIDWPGAYRVDVRHSQWRTLILDALIPEALDRGFNALFLDTLDVAEYLEHRDPRRYAGTIEAMGQLVLAIHEKYPALKLISNNGFAIIPVCHTALSACLVESVFTSYDFAQRRYQLATDGIRLDELDRIQERFHKTMLVLDYADDAALRHEVQSHAQARKLPVYVTTIGLQDLPPS